MNNPGYFAMDHFETYETSGVTNTSVAYAAKVYPNPATNILVVELNDKTIDYIIVTDAAGRLVARVQAEDKLTLNLSGYTPGIYMLTMQGETALLQPAL